MINFSFANVAKLVLGFFLSISQLAGKPVTPHASTSAWATGLMT